MGFSWWAFTCFAFSLWIKRCFTRASAQENLDKHTAHVKPRFVGRDCAEFNFTEHSVHSIPGVLWWVSAWVLYKPKQRKSRSHSKQLIFQVLRALSPRCLLHDTISLSCFVQWLHLYHLHSCLEESMSSSWWISKWAWQKRHLWECALVGENKSPFFWSPEKCISRLHKNLSYLE